MGEILSVCGVAIFAVFTLCIIREIRRELTVPLVLTMCAVFLCYTVPRLLRSVEAVSAYTEYIGNETVSYLIRAVGISYITWISCEICRSVGEGTVAGYVELAGRAELVLLCMPLIDELASLALAW